MKKAILFLAVFIFTAFAVSAQVSTSNQADADKKAAEQRIWMNKRDLSKRHLNKLTIQMPRLFPFEKTVQVMEPSNNMPMGDCEFKFTNDGKEPLSPL